MRPASSCVHTGQLSLRCLVAVDGWEVSDLLHMTENTSLHNVVPNRSTRNELSVKDCSAIHIQWAPAAFWETVHRHRNHGTLRKQSGLPAGEEHEITTSKDYTEQEEAVMAAIDCFKEIHSCSFELANALQQPYTKSKTLALKRHIS